MRLLYGALGLHFCIDQILSRIEDEVSAGYETVVLQKFWVVSARHLKASAGEHFGHASHAYLDRLTRDFDGIAPTVSAVQNEFVAENCPANADGQVSRVVARFALVAAGGEMATAFGVLPWEPGEAIQAAARCFRDWLDARGGVEPAEEREALSAVRRFIELHGNARFEPMGDLAVRDSMGAPIDTRIQNRAGFRRRDDEGGIEYLVLPEVWRGEVCAGLDGVAVAKTLAARGMLMSGEDGKLQKKVRLPGFSSSVRCYVIASSILGDTIGRGPCVASRLSQNLRGAWVLFHLFHQRNRRVEQ